MPEHVTSTGHQDERVLALLPTARDGERVRSILDGVGLGCVLCSDLAALCRELAAGAGVALLTEEAVAADRSGCLTEVLRAQPAWSDVPLIILARKRMDGGPAPFRESANVSLVERPVRMRSLLSVLRAALRSRRHQYQIRDHLAERERQEAALREKEEALRASDRKKDDFLALLAHELRNPLAPIRNGLQVLRLTDDPEVRERSQQMMERQLGHMVRLIDDLLDVSRINRNKLTLQITQISLADAVSSAVETARPVIDAAGHELIMNLPAEPVRLDADLTRLAQVFANLLTNSAKYTERGGRIVLTGRCEGDTVVVSVQDSGIGIPVDYLRTIFDMFSQVDRSIERSTGGLGIGLALVKGLVEMHGGTVSAASEGPGRGSTFTVRLPTVPIRAEVSPDQQKGRSEFHEGPKRRILVVDDNQDSAESMAEMLRLFGNEVDVAHDGVEAVERAGTFRPQLILMDVGMPRMNGLDATRHIREKPGGDEPTIIALTGWGQDSDRRLSKQAGCDGHLTKPVDIDELRRLLEAPKRT